MIADSLETEYFLSSFIDFLMGALFSTFFLTVLVSIFPASKLEWSHSSSAKLCSQEMEIEFWARDVFILSIYKVAPRSNNYILPQYLKDKKFRA